MGIRLGFHYHVPAEEVSGGILMPGFQGRFLDALANHCEELVCFLHTPRLEERALLDYRIQSPNTHLVGLGEHSSVPRRLLLRGRYAQCIKARRDQLDAVLLRGPSPLLPFMAHAAATLRNILLLVGDSSQGINDLPQPRWRKELIRLWWLWYQHRQNRIARHCLTFVNGAELLEKMRPYALQLHETRTTTLTSSDFYYREDTCHSSPHHLLYTGLMDRGKGILDMVEAIAIIASLGTYAVLALVGPLERNDPLLEDLTVLAKKRNIADRVHYHGYRPLGPELFSFYKQADMYVIASNNESFPRTIWEAMAHSLPVVATRVGSIPKFIEGAAKLVSPNNVGELVAAIRYVICDGRDRRDMIRKGREIASEMTLDKQVGKMLTTIEQWLSSHQGASGLSMASRNALQDARA